MGLWLVYSDNELTECFDNQEKDYGLLNGELFLISREGTSIFIYNDLNLTWTEMTTTGAPIKEGIIVPGYGCDGYVDLKKYTTVKGLENNG